MSVLLPELGPVVLRSLLRPLMQVAGFAVALGIIYNLHNFVRAVVGGVAGIVIRAPIIGNILKGPVNAVYHWMDTEFGKAEQFLDARMASSLHELARLVEWVGHEFKAHAALLLALSHLAANPFSLPAWKAYFHALLAEAHTATDAIKHAGSGYIGAAIHAALRPIQGELHALERWTYPRVKSLEREVTHDIPQDIAGLRTGAKTIEGELTKLYNLIRKNEAALAATAFAGAVALALSRLGLGWLRCSSLRNLTNRVGCGGFKILDELLAGVIDVLVIADLCQLTKLLIQVAESSEVQAVLSGVIGGIDELLLCQGVARPDELDGYWTEPPPPQKFAALPAV